jgi:hypothetical protein
MFPETFFRSKVNLCLCLEKMGWATFWAIFQKAHLATLAAVEFLQSQIGRKIGGRTN